MNTIRVSNSSDPGQARHLVGPNLGQNYLQRLSSDETSKQRVKVGVVFEKVNSEIYISVCNTRGVSCLFEQI